MGLLKGTVSDIIDKNYQELAKSWLRADESMEVHYLDGTKEVFTFTEEDVQRIKQLNQKASNKIYGFFGSDSMWKEPYIAFQTDYDKTSYYDESGNYELKKSDKGYLKDKYGTVYVTGELSDKEDIDKVYNECKAVADKIKAESAKLVKEALKATSDKRTQAVLKAMLEKYS